MKVHDVRLRIEEREEALSPYAARVRVTWGMLVCELPLLLRLANSTEV